MQVSQTNNKQSLKNRIISSKKTGILSHLFKRKKRVQLQTDNSQNIKISIKALKLSGKVYSPNKEKTTTNASNGLFTDKISIYFGMALILFMIGLALTFFFLKQHTPVPASPIRSTYSPYSKKISHAYFTTAKRKNHSFFNRFQKKKLNELSEYIREKEQNLHQMTETVTSLLKYQPVYYQPFIQQLLSYEKNYLKTQKQLDQVIDNLNTGYNIPFTPPFFSDSITKTITTDALIPYYLSSPVDNYPIIYSD